MRRCGWPPSGRCCGSLDDGDDRAAARAGDRGNGPRASRRRSRRPGAGGAGRQRRRRLGWTLSRRPRASGSAPTSATGSRHAGRTRARRHASPSRTPASARRATAAIASIDSSRSFYRGIETLFFGLSLGSVLVLAAIGLAITFGVMGVINMAHGELMMLGAYTTYVVQLADAQPHRSCRFWSRFRPRSSSPAWPGCSSNGRSSASSMDVRSRRCSRRSASACVLQQFVRSVFSANNRAVVTPPWMSGTLADQRGARHHLQPPLHRRCSRLVVFALLLGRAASTRGSGCDIRAVAQNRAWRGRWASAASGWTR